MLSILLINDNKIVSRLLKLSSQKHNYDLEEIVDYNPKKEAYNILFVDSGIYNNANLISLLSRVTFDKVAYIGDKTDEKPEEFDLILEKPFLPTDFVNIMNENFKVVDTNELEDEIALDDVEELEELDLDALEDIEEETKSDIDDKVEQSEEIKDEIVDVLSDIDELDEDIDIEINDKSEELDDTLQENIQESIKEIEEAHEDKSGVEDALKAVAAAGAGVAVGAVISEGKEEEKENEADINKALESINEGDLKDALGIESKSVEDDISNEEVIEEEILESDKQDQILMDNVNLEEMISQAVSKAITKEMLSEVLKDMEVVISFKPKAEG